VSGGAGGGARAGARPAAAAARAQRSHGAPSLFLLPETFIIFDWDDTLLSSSWLTVHGLRLDMAEVRARARVDAAAAAAASRFSFLAPSPSHLRGAPHCAPPLCPRL
jgi:hypothetical protein